jgi:hypothetical protein
MKIIPADESHLHEWLQMRLALWPECPSDELSQEIDRILVSDREASFLAVDDSGEVLGFLAYFHKPSNPWWVGLFQKQSFVDLVKCFSRF